MAGLQVYNAPGTQQCRAGCSVPLLLRSSLPRAAFGGRRHSIQEKSQQRAARSARGAATRPQAGSSRRVAAAGARQTVIPAPSYNIPAVLIGVSALSAFSGSVPVAAVTGVLGAFLAVQASRVKFIFGPDALEVRIGEAQEEFDNAFVGGPNTWKYDTFTNWEFWWPGFPVLVYFKETQTKPEGQIHFFPVIFDGKQVYDVMVERCGASQNSGPE